MGKRASLLLIIMLLLQTVISGAFPAFKTDANEQRNNVFNDIKYKDENGNYIASNEFEGNVTVEVSWSIANDDIQPGDVATVAISNELSLEQVSGDLLENDVIIGTYNTDSNNLIATFNDNVTEQPSASGEIILSGKADISFDEESESDKSNNSEVNKEIEGEEKRGTSEEKGTEEQQKVQSKPHMQDEKSISLAANRSDVFTIEIGQIKNGPGSDGEEYAGENTLKPTDPF